MRWSPQKGNDFLLPFSARIEGKGKREDEGSFGFSAETGPYENLMETDIVALTAALVNFCWRRYLGSDCHMGLFVFKNRRIF
jgi:hypothetical protein